MRRTFLLIVTALAATAVWVPNATGQGSRMSEVTVADGIAVVRGAADDGQTIHAYVDGRFSASTLARPEFELTLAVTPGRHRVCAYAIVPSKANPSLGCTTVDVDTAPAGPWVAVSSDFHVSTPGGRWPDNEERLEAFVAELVGHDTPPELLMVAGDMVDNVALNDGAPEAGSLQRWQADVARYEEIIAGLGDIEVRHALGPGHDFGSAVPVEAAAAVFGSERGFVDWRGTRLIWLESNPGAAALRWLEQALIGASDESVLVFHVALGTDATNRIDSSRTIPADDPIYGVIERHADRISAIVNGHIHRSSASRLFGIPVHLCPLIDSGSYCRLVRTGPGVVVERAALTPRQ